MMNRLKKVWENPLEVILFAIAGVVLLFLISVLFSDYAHCFFGEAFGLTEKSEVLKYLGITFSGALLALQQIYFYRRVKAMEQNAQSQTKAIELQTQSVNQERFKDAITHLSNEKESVRLGGIYTLAHLGRDQSEKYLTTAIEIIAAHLRTTTQAPAYQKKYAKQPSNEVQSALDLLFRKGKDSLYKKDSDMIIDLSHSFFNGVTLSNGMLDRVNFEHTELQGTNFREAQLQGADLRKAQLQGANLRKAQLQDSKLGKAQLQRANLEKAQLQGVDLDKAQLQGADLGESQLQGANLSEAQLQGADLTDAHLQRANLRKTQLQYADLMNTHLQGAYLVKTELQGTYLKEAQLGGVINKFAFYSGFKDALKKGVGKVGYFQNVIFSGGISKKEAEKREKYLRKLIEECPSYLDEEDIKRFKQKMELVIATYQEHSGKAASNALPEGAENIPYTQEQAEQWIVEYKEAMKEVDREQNT